MCGSDKRGSIKLSAAHSICYFNFAGNKIYCRRLITTQDPLKPKIKMPQCYTRERKYKFSHGRQLPSAAKLAGHPFSEAL